MDRLLSDLAHSVRRLARAPSFAVIAILTLALGIGANSAIFSLMKTIVLRPLPYGDPDRLVMLWASRDKGETTWIAGPEIHFYLDAAAGRITASLAVLSAALLPVLFQDALAVAGFRRT